MLPLEGVAEWFRMPVPEVVALCRRSGVSCSRTRGIADRDLDVLADVLHDGVRSSITFVPHRSPRGTVSLHAKGPRSLDEAARLPGIRARYGLTQGQAAALLGCSQTALAHWEQGDHGCPVGTADALDAACRDLREARR